MTRDEYAKALYADAVRRFGAARADTLKQHIDDAAGWMVEIATFPLDPDEPPAFYADPAS
jgi:hypothetical protein